MSRNLQAKFLATFFVITTVALMVMVAWDLSTPNGLSVAAFESRLPSR
jgi:hypothetical protein